MVRIMALLVAIALFASLPLVGAAHVVYVFEGSDFAYVNSAHTLVTVCDMETDGNGAYARYTRSGTSVISRIDDPNGSSAGCGQTNPIYSILALQVCEDVAFQPDPCSAWASA
ncbi:MAG: hypothetical protein RMJ05_04635 [Thermomicrobium sp.]|nr:hypothetical protein [Thermomicrobium sp.]MDW8005986.1 hypothetical protein [Thermomicrobium sp.]GBD19030.1 hypothetical protein HRbin27_01532 [bacterium HR27]